MHTSVFLVELTKDLGSFQSRNTTTEYLILDIPIPTFLSHSTMWFCLISSSFITVVQQIQIFLPLLLCREIEFWMFLCISLAVLKYGFKILWRPSYQEVGSMFPHWNLDSVIAWPVIWQKWICAALQAQDLRNRQFPCFVSWDTCTCNLVSMLWRPPNYPRGRDHMEWSHVDISDQYPAEVPTFSWHQPPDMWGHMQMIPGPSHQATPAFKSF